MLKSELIEENKRLHDTVDYLRSQLRLIPHSRFEKYRHAKDTNETLAYRKCAQEVDSRCLAALSHATDIQDGCTD